MAYDWSRFKLRIHIEGGIGECYQRWCSAAGLSSWFLREVIFHSNAGEKRGETDPVRPGDTYLWRWHGYPDEVQEKGTILSANHKDELSFSFGPGGKVRVRFFTEHGLTCCELEQFDIPTDENGMTMFHLGCSKGWVFYLANLKSIMEGGIDLRNKDTGLADVINS